MVRAHSERVLAFPFDQRHLSEDRLHPRNGHKSPTGEFRSGLVEGGKRAFGRGPQAAAEPDFDYSPKTITHKKAEKEIRLKKTRTPTLGLF